MTFSHPDYTIVRTLGRGGSASVHLAVQNSLNRRVALKVMHSAALHDPTVGKRFLREARIVARLNHPFIVPVYEVGQPSDTHGYYLTMEYLPAGSLSARKAEMSLADLRRTLAQIVDALAHAHENGFVHRDVKPDNILFRTPDDALLADFGIARLSQSLTSLTATGTIVGTPDYMSPEQVQGLAVDARTDLYSLGIVLFELLSGQRPFFGDSMMSIGIQHLTAPIPPLPPASAHFQPCVNRLLGKTPTDRPATVSEFYDEFDALCRSAPISLQTPLSSLHADAVTKPIPSVNLAGVTAQTKPAKKRVPTALIATTAALVLSIGVAAWYWRSLGFVPESDPATETTAETQAATKTTVTDPPADDQRADATRISADPLGTANSSVSTAATLPADSAQDELNVDSQEVSPSDSAVQVPTPSATEIRARELETAAREAFQLERWFGDEPDTAIQLYEELLTLNPNSVAAQDRLKHMFDTTQARIERAIELDDLTLAQRQLDELQGAWPDDARVQTITDSLASAQDTKRREVQAAELNQRIDALLAKATAAEQSGRWQPPAKDNALDLYQAVLEIDADNTQANDGLVAVVDQILREVDQAATANEFDTAEQLLANARALLPAHAGIERSELTLSQSRQRFAEQQLALREQQKLNEDVADLSQRVDAWLLDDGARLDATYDDLRVELTSMLQRSPDNTQLRQLIAATERQANVLDRASEGSTCRAFDRTRTNFFIVLDCIQ